MRGKHISTPLRLSHVRSKDPLGLKGVERKSTETYKHTLPSDKERIQELKKNNDRLEEENANLVEENSELKIRLEQQRTRHQNDLKQLERRLKSEFEDELKSALRIAIDSIEQRGPTVDLLSDPTNVEKQIISYFKT